MSSENNDQTPSEQPRNEKGQFTPKPQTANNGQSSQNFTDYAFVNAFMAKQLGLSAKFADLSQQYPPEKLYDNLKFLALTKEEQAQQQQQQPQMQQQPQGLPPNQQAVPMSPVGQRNDQVQLPGTQMHKPNLTADDFNVSFSIQPKDLIKRSDK